ncbi:hypothetical protein D3C84_399840 [compost metagenome]
MIRHRRWPPWAPSRSAARRPAAGTGTGGPAHRFHPPAAGHLGHRARRRPGASSMIRRRRWRPWAPCRSAAGPAACSGLYPTGIGRRPRSGWPATLATHWALCRCPAVKSGQLRVQAISVADAETPAKVLGSGYLSLIGSLGPAVWSGHALDHQPQGGVHLGHLACWQ